MKCRICGKEISEPVYPLHVNRCKEKNKKEEVEKIDVSEFHTGGGWYKYEGESYRKDELKELLGE